jgi:AcrR family transcriptional regulator
MAIDATSPSRPGPRPSSSRAEIVQCAIRMMDRDGTETLSFRAMARELGITVGALSRYFRNLADLQDEVAASIMAELRPLEAGSKLSLRDQLLRLAMHMLEMNLTHPYLLRIHGPASAAMVGRNARQSLKVLVDAGIGFDRAMAIFSTLGALAYAWAVQAALRAGPEMEARQAQAVLNEMGEFAPQLTQLLASDGANLHRQTFELYIDAALAAVPAPKKRR